MMKVGKELQSHLNWDRRQRNQNGDRLPEECSPRIGAIIQFRILGIRNLRMIGPIGPRLIIGSRETK